MALRNVACFKGIYDDIFGGSGQVVGVDDGLLGAHELGQPLLQLQMYRSGFCKCYTDVLGFGVRVHKGYCGEVVGVDDGLLGAHELGQPRLNHQSN